MERHQFGFGFMRWDTGGEKVKSFWGKGETIEECRKDALRQAQCYRSSYECELNAKAKEKAAQRGERYVPSHIQVHLNGIGTFWK